MVLLSFLSTNMWSFAALTFVFGIIPFLELFLNASTINLSPELETDVTNDKFYDYILYALVPIQYLLLTIFLVNISKHTDSIIYTIGAITAFGVSCGVLGINAAHELGHRNTSHERFMSKALLLTTMYMHFYIEHNRGHHAKISTAEDPASSKYGESIYQFFVRSIVGSYISAWQLESKKLKTNKTNFFSLKNEMIIFHIIQFILLIIISILFGIKVLGYYLISALIGIILLESVNYIEHYGLRRKKIGDKYERTLPIHSWNSNHPLGRLLLLELSRHSDHHYIASRKYQTLRHFDNSPQMPSGYPAMILVAFIPPLWFKVMHPIISRYKQSTEGSELA